ncbi:MAG: ABC transporter ATP-binding protein [Sulfurospirillum sp.]|nr:ABC transporter ATP-binding protein [Sulfurospirillum sp.]
MGIIKIENVSFSYEDELVLENINLHVSTKDFLAIIGPNGGGKSTLLQLILGVLQPKSGTITLFGEKTDKKSMRVGYVPQNTNVNTHFPIKVLEVVMMGHTGSKRPFIGYGKDEIACAMSSLTQVGMEAFAQKKIGDLSGGERQRVMIARALCAHPTLLLLDEPTANIDAKGQKKIYELLKKLNEDITIVVISHDIAISLEYAKKVAYINKTLSFHDMSHLKRNKFFTQNEHFCEVELLSLVAKL